MDALRKFKVGDFVKSKHGIGIVAWTANKSMNIKEEDNMLGIDLQTDSRGFAAPVKEEDCEGSSLKDVISYYEFQARDAGIRCQEYANKSRNYEAMRNENILLKNLLMIYLDQSREEAK